MIECQRTAIKAPKDRVAVGGDGIMPNCTARIG